jgi:hypothetical protein
MSILMDYGYFVGEPSLTWLSGDSRMKLLKKFEYVDRQGNVWTAPEGVIVDGASIPRIFWTLIGSPFTGPYRNASIIHDVYCVNKIRPWDEVHETFYWACLAGGTSAPLAKTLFYAVYHFGPCWVHGKNIVRSDAPSDLDPGRIYEDMQKFDFSLEDIKDM